MMQPDTLEITEVFLYASGYKNAKQFARKIVKFYKTCKEILTTEAHYDFSKFLKKIVELRFFLLINFIWDSRPPKFENIFTSRCKSTHSHPNK